MSRIATIAVLACFGFGAQAYAGPLGIGLPSLPGGVVTGVTGPLGPVVGRTTDTLDQTLDQNLQGLGVVRDTVGRPRQARALEKDPNGFRVVRGEVLALSPSDKSLAIARGLDFEILRQDRLASLGLSVTVLRVPNGMSASDGLAALRKADPQGAYDVDHVYDPSGGTANADRAVPEQSASSGGTARIGMIDGGVERRHGAFEHATIVDKGFVPGGAAVATKHGTAVASLLVGSDGDVAGALPGATLYAADVYCGQAAGGSADAIAQALAWLAANDVPVANVSLAGPANAILAAAVKAFVQHGHVLVAAVGNDGPAAGVEYPAGYPGVAGVTSVDGRYAIQLDANRGPDVAFAARGVGVSAAVLNGRHDTVTGTSFAAPIVAARFALLMPHADARTAAQAWNTLERAALHLGPAGRNDVFGYGFLDRPHLSSATAATN